MKILPLKISHYDNIYKLAKKEGWLIYDRISWKNLWYKNTSIKIKKWPKGWIIKNKYKKIVACIASFPLDYLLNNKIYTASVLTSWIVDKSIKFKSILMHQHYFNNSKADFFLNTSSNINSKSVWLALRGKEILSKDYERFFLPLNFNIFYKKFLKKKNFIINIVFSNLLNIFFLLFFLFKFKKKNNFKLKLKFSFDQEFDNFFKKFFILKKSKKKLYLKKNTNFLNWHFSYHIKKKLIKIFLYYKNNQMIGYVICIIKKNNINNYKKISIVDYEFLFSDRYKIKNIFIEVINNLKKQNFAFVDLVLFEKKYKKIFKKLGFFKYSHHNSFLYKNGNNRILNKKIKSKLFTNFKLIDGDSVM